MSDDVAQHDGGTPQSALAAAYDQLNNAIEGLEHEINVLGEHLKPIRHPVPETGAKGNGEDPAPPTSFYVRELGSMQTRIIEARKRLAGILDSLDI